MRVISYSGGSTYEITARIEHDNGEIDNSVLLE